MEKKIKFLIASAVLLLFFMVEAIYGLFFMNIFTAPESEQWSLLAIVVITALAIFVCWRKYEKN